METQEYRDGVEDGIHDTQTSSQHPDYLAGRKAGSQRWKDFIASRHDHTELLLKGMRPPESSQRRSAASAGT